MNSALHLKIRVKSAGHRTVSGWSLTTLYGAQPGIGRCYHIRRRPAPVRYVTTQEKILIKFAGDVQICEIYDVSFICDHSISYTAKNNYLAILILKMFTQGSFLCSFIKLGSIEEVDWRFSYTCII